MPLLFFLILLLPYTAHAEIFAWEDEYGRKHFSDKPQHNARHLKINPGYSYYFVKKVFDGDTVLLSNGKKVRFLGVNTPEVEGRNKSAQAGGDDAKQWLIEKLKNKKVRLEPDVEKKDKYGRLLAHLFTEQKEHLNLELVKRGLASVNIYPPNLKYSDEFLRAQKIAETDKQGIWHLKEYAPKPAKQIKNGSFKGWQRVKGRIKNIRQSRKYSYLDFTDVFSVKIAKKSLGLFPDLNNYIGKKVEVRGWISKQKKRYSMFVRHPAAIVFIE